VIQPAAVDLQKAGRDAFQLEPEPPRQGDRTDVVRQDVGFDPVQAEVLEHAADPGLAGFRCQAAPNLALVEVPGQEGGFQAAVDDVGERQPADDPSWILAQRQPEGDRAPGLEILPFRGQVLLLLAQGEQAFRPGGKPGLVKEPVAAIVVQDIRRGLLANDAQQEARCPERV